MQKSAPDWGRRSLEFVDQIEVTKTSSGVVALFEKMIGELGFHAYIMAGIPMPGQSLDQLTVANGWPKEWFDLYNRESLSAVDPVPRHCLSTLNPFEWKDAPYDIEREPDAHRVMTRARDFRLNEGFCIPIHYEDSTGAVSIAGERPDLDPEIKSAVHLMSVFSHGRLRALAKSNRTDAATKKRKLNKMEVEVLSWAARGKTAWETSRILRIPERTARWHLEEAQRKLSTNNKTATVAAALVNKEISL